MPLRSLVSLGSFSMCSNIAAQTNTSTLRFIAEDLGLFISEKVGNVVDLRRDYVRVMDLDLFDLSLNLNDKMSNRSPRVDLRASNNVLHIRTCSDSARALTQLLIYFASDGDMAPNPTENVTIPAANEEQTLLGNEGTHNLSQSQVDRVNTLMEEAMADMVTGIFGAKMKDWKHSYIFVTSSGTTTKVSSNARQTDNQVEVFFFPDESHPIGQSSVDRCEPYDTDEEFCIVGEDAGVGMMPKYGVPEVRWLSEEYLRIVDNHFAVPLGKTDELKAPKHFPKAVLSYTLREMTLVWHMYGGRDFGSSLPVAKKHVTIDDGTQRNDNVFQGRCEPSNLKR